MGNNLFNILQKLRQVKDFVVTAGPVGLRTAKEAFLKLADASEQIAIWIEAFGPMVQFTPGSGDQHAGGIDTNDAQRWLRGLEELKAECESETEKVQAQIQAAPGGAQAGFLDKLSPAFKKVILDAITTLISQLMSKIALGGAGGGSPPTAPAETPKGPIGQQMTGAQESGTQRGGGRTGR